MNTNILNELLNNNNEPLLGGLSQRVYLMTKIYVMKMSSLKTKEYKK